MERSLGETLKELRKNMFLTAKDVSIILKNMGYSISDKTLSGYENGIRMPNADVFMALCQIYKCKNILEIFSFVEADYSIPTDNEWNIIEKYRDLDEQGRETVSYLLDREVSRTQTEQDLYDRISELEGKSQQHYFMTYYQKLASAGTGEYLFDDVPTETIEVPDDEISRQADFVIGVNGGSMEPDYCDGEKVYVKKTDDIPVGKVGIFIQGNECYIKEKGVDCLISRNKKYADLIPSDDIRLIGEVIGKVES